MPDESNQKTSWIIGIGVAGLCALAIFFALPHSPNLTSPGQGFYSDDDGVTWFADVADKVVPFDHNGKQAVRAYVYECGGKKFVGRLERMTAEKQQLVEQAKAAVKSGAPPPKTPPDVGPFDWGMESKKPGDRQWISSSDLQEYAKLMQIRCPEGGQPTEVSP